MKVILSVPEMKVILSVPEMKVIMSVPEMKVILSVPEMKVILSVPEMKADDIFWIQDIIILYDHNTYFLSSPVCHSCPSDLYRKLT